MDIDRSVIVDTEPNKNTQNKEKISNIEPRCCNWASDCDQFELNSNQENKQTGREANEFGNNRSRGPEEDVKRNKEEKGKLLLRL